MNMMKAIQVVQLGGPELLHYGDVPRPTPAANEVLIQIEAASVNYADTMQRRGIYPGGPQPPYIPGLEVAGRVVELGASVSNVEVGQPVMTLTGRGGYAQFVSVPASMLMPVPEDFSMEQAAAFPIVFLTAFFALKRYGRLQAGESVLIQAAGGGVGTAAVQLAKHMGARVFACAGSDEKLERVRALGADEIINYRTNDFADVVKHLTGGRGVDLVLETVGGNVFEKSMTILAPFGRLVTYGAAGGQLGSVNSRTLIMNNATVTGVNLNLIARTPELGPAMCELLGMIRGTSIRPIIGHTFALDQAADAHRLIESRESFGKIVLRVSQSPESPIQH
ncbi:MAG: NADPH:quinone oxidoreductase family protein [Acidobacteriota bacterium]|nr:NADPH:quinone oxidoreductase family protein [Blastocatellia bacterium]MDW8238112.1 NADPH:quinone oxidoreductase family protein [Acidobacteriota bacterium]